MTDATEENTTPEPTLEAKIESLLFVADGPTPISVLAETLEVKPRFIKKALATLESDYETRGLRLQHLKKDRVQMTTAPENAGLVERFLGLDSKSKLSKAALEALAIIAYQQPLSRPQIDAVRGVNSDYVIKRLHTAGLIEEVGRAETPGRPILYGTTATFLQEFGLSALEQLPPIDLGTLSPSENEETNEDNESDAKQSTDDTVVTEPAPAEGTAYAAAEPTTDTPAESEEPSSSAGSGWAPVKKPENE